MSQGPFASLLEMIKKSLDFSLAATSLHEFAFVLELISKRAHVVLYGCLFLETFSLPF